MTMRNSVAIAALFVLATACKPSLLPGTAVEDTADNRAVVDFVQEYSAAVEARSADAVMGLVAPDYWEDLGTVDQSDDYGVEKLQADLARNFDHAKAIHLEIFVQQVIFDEDGDLVSVDYKYKQRALLSFEAGDRWVSHTDVNRLVLRKAGEDEEDGFRIVSGL
jgi:hypothetical protein